MRASWSRRPRCTASPSSVPEPMETVFISWYDGGEVFRSGLTFQRGAGRIFYFSPGHEIYPIYHDKNVRQVSEERSEMGGTIRRRPGPGMRQAPNVPIERRRSRSLRRGRNCTPPAKPGCGELSCASSSSAPAAWRRRMPSPSPPNRTSRSLPAVEPHPERLAAFAAEHNIPNRFTSLDEAIAWGEFDAAANVTPDARPLPDDDAAHRGAESTSSARSRSRPTIPSPGRWPMPPKPPAS